MKGNEWRMAVVVLVAIAAGALLGRGGGPTPAQAQIAGSARGVICVLGQERNGYAPIVLVDQPDQTFLVYKYSYMSGRVELTSVRTFQFDQRLGDWNTDGPSVDDIRQYLSNQGNR
ncbi:MAG: hypothetical protein J7M08_10190 [Planctomycetes bacterium]|nr:hypothetical protein [Planctomycetota bacterium]